MIGKGYFSLLTAVLFFVSCSKKLVPESPLLTPTDFKLDSLPNSEFNIPIQVNLKPVYAVAEKNIDTVFTSPNWPNDWISEDCGTRYKYHFRRGPLQFKASGLSLNLGFTGYYQIIGSTRACVNGVVLSPWTPACRCGFEEGERKVSVAFHNSISLSPDYKIRLSIQRMEPVAQDKCSVCFWGQNITPVVINGLKEELDLSKKAIEDSFSIVDLKQKFQAVWQKINEPFNLYGLGAISPYIAAFLMVFCISFPTGFFLAKYVVFSESTLRGRVQLVRYFGLAMICLLLNYIFLKLFVEQVGIFPTPAKILTSVIVVFFSYMSQKYFTFKVHGFETVKD